MKTKVIFAVEFEHEKPLNSGELQVQFINPIKDAILTAAVVGPDMVKDWLVEDVTVEGVVRYN